MRMMRLHPLTFRVFSSNYVAGEKIRNKISSTRKSFSGLSELNDQVYKFFAKEDLEDLPSDTRFPGFFTSLADHSLLTSAIALAIALDLRKKGLDFLDSRDYSESFVKYLQDPNNLKEIVRCASLLHDIGKHPPTGHNERTREYTNQILKMVGFGKISEDIAKLASRHHYREDIREDFRPKTKLEWIVAIADKVSVLERMPFFVGREFSEVYGWLLEKLDGNLSEEDRKKIAELKEYIEGKRTEVSDVTLLPLDLKKLAEIDRLVFNPKEVFGAEPEIGILCLEIAGIQKFVTASDYRKYISGASILLENVLREVREYLEDLLAPENVIYAKGGSLLAIIPVSYYPEIKQYIVELFERRTIVVRPKLPDSQALSYTLSEIKYGPKVCQEKVELVDRRNFGAVVSRTISFLEEDRGYLNIGSEEKLRTGEICRSCYELKGEEPEKIDDEDVKICKRCKLVIKEHERTKEALIFSVNLEKSEVENLEKFENEFWIRLLKRFQEKLRNSNVVSELLYKKVNEVTFRVVKTWDHLGRQHFSFEEHEDKVYDVAFVKGDGDNFGKTKEKASSPSLFREFSKTFEEVIEGSIVEAFSDMLIKELEVFNKWLETKGEAKTRPELEIPFDVVYIGGDDFLVVMDPVYVFTFLKSFRAYVQKMLGKKTNKYSKEPYQCLSIVPLGVSMGVAVVKSRAPIGSTLRTLESMVKKAKEKSKSDERPFGSEIYVYMQKFEQIPTIDEVEAFEGFTSFPMSGEEFEKFVEELRFFADKKASPNWIRRVFGRSMPENSTEACINLLFKMARTKKDTYEFEMLKKIYEIHGKFVDPVKYKYKHIDLSDALRILTENVEEKLRVETARILLGD
jgi:GGDEF domain-containing protein